MSEIDRLSSAVADVSSQMSRVDTKASMLLAGSLTAVSVGIAGIARLPLTAIATGVALAAVTAIAVAVALLITAVRPQLAGNHGFVRWAQAPTASALLADIKQQDNEHEAYQAHQLLSLSRSVHRKYRLVRLATDLLRVALVLAVVTAILVTC